MKKLLTLTGVLSWINIITGSILVLAGFIAFFISPQIITILFAAIFKFLPDAKIKWRDVWAGAILTAILFVIAKFALGQKFDDFSIGSVSCKLTYPVGHRRFVRNPNPV